MSPAQASRLFAEVQVRKGRVTRTPRWFPNEWISIRTKPFSRGSHLTVGACSLTAGDTETCRVLQGRSHEPVPSSEQRLSASHQLLRPSCTRCAARCVALPTALHSATAGRVWEQGAAQGREGAAGEEQKSCSCLQAVKQGCSHAAFSINLSVLQCCVIKLVSELAVHAPSQPSCFAVKHLWLHRLLSWNQNIHKGWERPLRSSSPTVDPFPHAHSPSHSVPHPHVS